MLISIRGEPITYLDSPAEDKKVLVGGHSTAPVQSASPSTTPQRSADTGALGSISPVPRETGSLGLAPERANLTAVGIPQNTINTIQSARAPSTRFLYDRKWRMFEDWCRPDNAIPSQCSVLTVLLTVLSLLERGRAFIWQLLQLALWVLTATQ